MSDKEQRTYQIDFVHRQGVLPRILGEVTRRGITLDFVTTAPGKAILTIQIDLHIEAQLMRAWRSIVDVTNVR